MTLDRLMRAIERYDRTIEDLRILAWCTACNVYLIARGRTRP